ncbi:MAG TPA: SDR family NAD(P)-dependent oxidoreductase [Longimicrobium sp.]|nr:SDR family NAD(P)-dependent oxidoreductase [Longimicrobium sp.]
MSEQTLAGRHAIITGGGRGIGLAIAGALAARGAHLTLTGRDAARLQEAASQLVLEHGIRAQGIVCDVTDEEGVAGAFDRAAEALGPPYILVNNAGQAEGAPFAQTSRELWDRLIAVNLTGTFLCTRAVLPAMQAAGEGRIVNVASIAGLKGASHIAAYCASKHGVVGLTRALAAETARQGITANAVCPGYTDTDMSGHAVSALVAAGRSQEEALKMMVRPMGIGRLIRPEEVAGAVAWLCSPEAAAVTGQAIVVAGVEVT